jgi:ACR3 family arsenite efflux pump ArsB
MLSRDFWYMIATVFQVGCVVFLQHEFIVRGYIKTAITVVPAIGYFVVAVSSSYMNDRLNEYERQEHIARRAKEIEQREMRERVTQIYLQEEAARAQRVSAAAQNGSLD